jgi:hypothetical protein
VTTWPRIAREPVPSVQVRTVCDYDITGTAEAAALFTGPAVTVQEYEPHKDLAAADWARYLHIVAGGDHYLVRQTITAVHSSGPLTYAEAIDRLMAVTFGQAR